MNNLSNVRFNSPEEIIDVINGTSAEYGTKFCALSFIEKRRADLRKQYSPAEYIKKHPIQWENSDYITCMKINSTPILQIIAASTLVGGGVGFLAGSCIANCAGSAIGTTIGVRAGVGAGVAVGLGVGLAICYEKDLHLSENYVFTRVQREPKYIKLKSDEHREDYEIMKSFLNNYAYNFPDKYENTLNSFVCTISKEIMDCPMFSPYDTKFNHPYEKKVLEEHISNVELQAEDYKINAEERGVDAQTIEKKVNEILASTCPIHQKRIEKGKLIYDPKFTLRIVEFLTKVHDNLKLNIKTDEDPVVLCGIELLISHYKSQYNAVNAEIMNKLAGELFKVTGDMDFSHKAMRSMIDKTQLV